jgi:hypothetical protein
MVILVNECKKTQQSRVWTLCDEKGEGVITARSVTTAEMMGWVEGEI